jgi:phospholipase C
MALADMKRNIRHVVHLMLENRGFDSLLGWLYDPRDPPKLNVPRLRPGEVPFYGVPRNSDGTPSFWFPTDASYYADAPYRGPRKLVHKGLWGYCYMPAADPGEDWNNTTQQIFGPDGQMGQPDEKLMRGFYLNYVAQGIGVGSNDDILATGTPTDVSVLNGLAKAYTVSDTWFSSAPTETNPNRAFSLAGTSAFRKDNLSFDGVPFEGLRTIFGVLNDTGHTWKLYADNTWINGLYFTQYMFPEGMENPRTGSIADFAADVANDRLPVFSYLEPTFATESPWNPLGDDYHPPGSIFEGESFLKRVYDALTANPAVFAKTLFIITFDEHGGTFDHVVPPPAVPPDELDPPYIFGRYGVRVPTVLVSPWVPPGSVFRAGYYPGGTGTPFDHTSVLATILRWLDIPYTSPTDVGWLRRRTPTAPSFEDVIGSTYNPVVAPVTPYGCSDLAATAGATGLAPSQVLALLARVTSYRKDDPRLAALVSEAETTCRSKEDFGRFLQRLRKEHGSVRRDRPAT